MSETATKREREKAMVSEMIALYCHKNHHTHGKLCDECAALDNYARTRVETAVRHVIETKREKKRLEETT